MLQAKVEQETSSKTMQQCVKIVKAEDEEWMKKVERRREEKKSQNSEGIEICSG